MEAGNSEIQEQASADSKNNESGGQIEDQSIAFEKVLNDSLLNQTEEFNKEANSDSDGDIFYDACDVYILDQIQDEIKRESEVSELYETVRDDEFRTTLPAYKSEGKFSLLKIIKDAIGKDITRFCVPVYFNEPISMLQKVSEIMVNSDLMEKASAEKDSLMRLAYVAAFSVGQYGYTTSRTTKPFNPILGETYEYLGKGFKLFAEQVSHHPPVSALHVESKEYTIQMNTMMSTHFWGKSLEFKPQGEAHVWFHDTGDHFLISRPNTS